MPEPHPEPARDWWQDAAQRPLGAYYRVDSRSVTDMHAALHEVGVLYASAVCHSGWDEGFDLPAARRRDWIIPQRPPAASDGGHAFVLAGWDSRGFRVLNSWGKSWGESGYAILAYEDWLENAMDCWVAQLGVVTEQHQAVSASASLRTDVRGKVTLSSEPLLRQREISPFIVNMQNNGDLSGSGKFRTSRNDLQALLEIHLDRARSRWRLGKTAPVDVAIYAHGGLTSEEAAAGAAARWVPALYDAQIFPIFLMWETDFLSTLKNRFADLLAGEVPTAAGVRDTLSRWWNKRLERAFAAPGTFLWKEMKQNAGAIGTRETSGARQLFDIGSSVPGFAPARVRLHLIGHSAGAILHCHLLDSLVRLGWKFALRPLHGTGGADGRVRFHLAAPPALPEAGRFHQFHLTAGAEERDTTCRPLLGYGRSLLWLVSESFEGGRPAEILGMENYFDAFWRQRSVADLRRHAHAWAAPSRLIESTTHGDFDDDGATLRAMVALIKGQDPARLGAARAKVSG